MAKCPQCGKINDNDARFCEYCGIQLFLPDQTSSAGKETYTFRNRSLRQVYPDQEEYFEKGRRGKRSSYPQEDEYTEEDTYRERRGDGQKRKGSGRRGFRAVYGLILLELIIMIAVIYGGYTLIQSAMAPDKTAEKYLSAELSGKWTQAFQYLDITSTTGLTAKDYVYAKGDSQGGIVTDLQITDDQTGLSVDDTEGDVRYLHASYLLDGESGETTLTLRKTGQKKYYFFDEWKVDAEELYGTNITITTPAGATVTMNGEELTDPDPQTVETEVNYTIPAMFYGQYLFEFTEANCDSHREVKDYLGDNIYFGDLNLRPSDETRQKVFKQLVSDWPQLLNAALDRDDFNTVQDYFYSGALTDGSAQQGYQEQCSSSYDPESGSGYTTIELSNINASLDSSSSAQQLVWNVTATASKIYTEQGSGQIQQSDVAVTVIYRLENGSWKLQSYPLVG